MITIVLQIGAIMEKEATLQFRSNADLKEKAGHCTGI